MSYSYDDQNVFARILRGEIPNETLFETEHSLAFHDINPLTPVHVLVVPKGPYVNFDHFAAEASEAEIADFTRSVGRACRETGAAEPSGGNGYRTISNAGPDGVQDVPHFHMHILAGRVLGGLVKRA